MDKKIDGSVLKNKESEIAIFDNLIESSNDTELDFSIDENPVSRTCPVDR